MDELGIEILAPAFLLHITAYGLFTLLSCLVGTMSQEVSVLQIAGSVSCLTLQDVVTRNT